MTSFMKVSLPEFAVLHLCAKPFVLGRNDAEPGLDQPYLDRDPVAGCPQLAPPRRLLRRLEEWSCWGWLQSGHPEINVI